MDIELHSALYDDSGEGTLSFLVNKTIVKYVDIEKDIYDPVIMGIDVEIIPQLPPFPPGAWNKEQISKDSVSGEGYFSKVEKAALPGVTTSWHPVSVDVLQLELRTMMPSVKRVSNFHCPALLKRDICNAFIDTLERETAAYQWLEGTNIGPRFLGHATENDRIVGFLVEEVIGARHAGPGDLKACQEALAKLHGLGILHGDINKFNFLIRDNKAVLIDFSEAKQNAKAEELGEEMARLESELNDPGFRGGVEIIS